MSLQRHVYRPPRGRMSGIFAILGGIIATVIVFVAIPLSQKLNEQFSLPTSKVPPNYPSSLLSKGIGGKVLVACVIDADGRISSTKIRQSSGHPELDKAAMAAVARWKFKPGSKAGRMVRASCVVPFNFEVKKN